MKYKCEIYRDHFQNYKRYNCIARTYTHIYAEGKCDLYYVKLDGKIAI